MEATFPESLFLAHADTIERALFELGLRPHKEGWKAAKAVSRAAFLEAARTFDPREGIEFEEYLTRKVMVAVNRSWNRVPTRTAILKRREGIPPIPQPSIHKRSRNPRRKRRVMPEKSSTTLSGIVVPMANSVTFIASQIRTAAHQLPAGNAVPAEAIAHLREAQASLTNALDALRRHETRKGSR